MEEIIDYIKDCLLEFQDDYSTGEPKSIINLPQLTLIYTSARSREMHIGILNSISLRKRLKQKHVTLTDLDIGDNSVILTCTLSNG